jgi:integrase/recombinase XerD
VAGSIIMLIDHVERYISMRQTLGFSLCELAQRLRSFARFAMARGDVFIRTSSAMEWAASANTSSQRHMRLQDVIGLARFLRAEDPAHEMPQTNPFSSRKTRPLPYIYSPEEVAQIVVAAGELRPTKSNPLRPQTYSVLFGLIAATGLRISEAVNLRIDDVLSEGILQIRRTKFRKNRLVPMHPTATDALNAYLQVRRKVASTTDHIFLSGESRPLSAKMAQQTFRQVRRAVPIAPKRTRSPRIHDLRHTFATRALERCSNQRDAVNRHLVALATYMGHANIACTYWYLEATPQLLTDISAAAHVLFAGEES